MKLELDILNIKDVRFTEKTGISKGVIHINRQELQELLQQDKRFSEVDIELAHPGERCRVVPVFDVIEPRSKMGGIGENFPGALGRIKSAGEGRTRVLRGAAVVTIDCTAGGPRRPRLIDMAGPGATLGLYGNLQNIVIICPPVNGIAPSDYLNALRAAGLKAAVYLAEAAKDLQGDETEVYNLGPLTEAGREMTHLPRVAYIYQIDGRQHMLEKPTNEPVFYGDNVSRLLPTIVHPNEILDGALVRGYAYGEAQETFDIQNHPMIRELYNRHGTDLCFVGVVITVGQFTEPERERSAAIAANLVKSVLGADGAVFTRTGGWATHVDMMQTADLCEELGIKTAVVAQSVSRDDDTAESALVFSTPRVDAVVNVGNFGKSITLPAMERIIGSPVEGEIKVTTDYDIDGANNTIGASRVRMREI
ncbi:glycine/sarcosine/betaine reductase component B subunit [Chloroflexota bacterium]